MKAAFLRQWAPGNFPKSFGTTFSQKNFVRFLSVPVREFTRKVDKNGK